MIWSLLLLSLASADKLDRTYLPPPGFKLSGGSPGSIQVPLEHPKLQYTSGKNEYHANPEIAVGINRVAPNRPVNIYSTTDSPVVHSENNIPSSTTIIPYPTTNNVPFINEYSTSRPVDYTSKYNGDFNNSGFTDYYNREQMRGQQPLAYSNPSINQFQITKNYPQLIQNVPVADISNDYYANGYFNQSKPDGDLDSIINTISKSTFIPQVGTDPKINQFGSGEHSSIPTTQAYSKVISSTFAPSTVNYDHITTIRPNQFYSSTSKPTQFSTAKPINYKFASVPNYTSVKMRPERIQAQADREASILNYESNITPDGYFYTYDTSNGIHADETGVTVDGTKAKGSYSYIGDDGKLYNVVYTADEHGFQPKGDHLPTSPPIPEAILKVIEQVTKEKEAGITDDGSYDDNKYGYRRYHNGFYTPKGDFSKQHSDVGDEQNKYVKKVISNYDGAIGNQIPGKIGRVPNKYKTIINSESTTSGPVSKNYSGTNKYIENIDSQYVQQPYFFGNESVTKNFGPVLDDDVHTNGGDAKNRFTDQQNVYKQVNNSPLFENERKHLIGAYMPTEKAFTNSYSVFQGKYNQNSPYEYDKENFTTETGYTYNPPSYKGNDELHSRYFDNYNVRNKTLIQNKNNNTTPKPFQTPDVTREDGYSQEYDSYEKSYEDSGEYYDPLHPGVQFNNNVKHNVTDILGIPHVNNEIHKTYDNHMQTANKGYLYEQIIIGRHPSDHFIADPNSYSSTAVPTEITTRIAMLQTQEPNFNIHNTKEDRKSTKYMPNVYQTKFQFDKTNKLPDYSTIRPGFSYNSPVLPTGAGSVYPETGFKETNINVDLATAIPTLQNSYSPGLEINHYEEHNSQPTTEKVIGEDFSGPKQPQRFDPITGYHY